MGLVELKGVNGMQKLGKSLAISHEICVFLSCDA